MSSFVSSLSSPSIANRHQINVIRIPAINFPVSSQSIHSFSTKQHSLQSTKSKSKLASIPRSSEEDGDSESLVQDLRVPHHWLLPSKALEESEWLRVTLHKWLDDEYCPEETNVEISKVAADSYYGSLLEKQTDIGEILLKMARELESISYQDSFHGAFSSANAAVSLIVERIEKL